jgi:multicomponent Na+:H+ antiporter subunit D
VLGTLDLRRSGGLYEHAPVLAILFFVPAMALAGIPPLSGFFAKFALVQAGLEAGQGVIVAVALGVSVLTLFSMTKIWAAAFWKPLPAGEGRASEISAAAKPGTNWTTLLVPTATLGVLTIVLGVAAEPFFALALRAAEQLVDPTTYVQAVLR